MPTQETPRERLDDATLRAAMEGRNILEVAHATELGEHLRAWRTAKGLSLRAAAAFLERVALVYSVPTPEVLRAAGYSLREVRDVRDAVDQAFLELVLDPRLCPTGMDPKWLDAFSTKQKGQWLEFAHKLYRFYETEGYDPVDREVVQMVSVGE